MLSLDAGDELELVVETARRLAADELAPRMRTAEAERGAAPALHAAWDEVGLAGLEWPEPLGGAGLGCLARVLVNEELAAGDVGAALALDRAGPAAAALLEVGGEPAVQALLAALGGAGRAALVLAEDGRFVCGSDGVRGDVPWVPADAVDALVVLAGDETWLVTEGIEVEPLRGAGLRAAGASRLRVDGAPRHAAWTDAEAAARARARARLYYASLLVGVMRAAWDFAAAYAGERHAFGKPIAHHQALAFFLVDMRMTLDAARLVVHEAAWRVDAGLPCAAEAAGAFAECIEAARTIGPGAVQVLGGHGFMADYPVEKHMREARALALCLGGFDAAIEEAGRLVAASDAPLALGRMGAL